MSMTNRTLAAQVRTIRERTIATLQDHFAYDDLDVDEFERRVTAAHTTESPAEIEALTQDLPPLPADVAAPATTGAAASTALATSRAGRAATSLVPASEVKDVQTIRGFMSATTRSGPWAVPRRMIIKATMSSAVLDFREARFPAGVVEIDVRAVMSSAEIIVPPGLAVETDGSAI
ncbi:MAG: DUF1707 domain-containing protein, partial [Pseudomonadota bacterium]